MNEKAFRALEEARRIEEAASKKNNTWYLHPFTKEPCRWDGLPRSRSTVQFLLVRIGFGPDLENNFIPAVKDLHWTSPRNLLP